jgi:dihydroorotase
LVTDAAGWGRNIKPIQKMPTPKPRNTEHYSGAIVKASAHESQS